MKLVSHSTFLVKIEYYQADCQHTANLPAHILMKKYLCITKLHLSNSLTVKLIHKLTSEGQEWLVIAWAG